MRLCTIIHAIEVGRGGGGLKVGKESCLGNYSSGRERRKVTLH